MSFWGRPVLGPEVYDAGIYEDPDEAFAALLAVEQSLVDEVVAAVGRDASGSLDPVAERVFGSLDHDVLLIEWSDPARHGGFEALRFAKPDTTVVLGIVDTKSRTVETEDELLAKLEEASQYVDIAQLAISPQCGFSSAVGINDATEIQWQKIEVMCRVADRVWGRA